MISVLYVESKTEQHIIGYKKIYKGNKITQDKFTVVPPSRGEYMINTIHSQTKKYEPWGGGE